ncbi:MAG: hypothetical protein OXE92_11135 [Bacteroidetes bacterium]|nr:hypothetical protein [Bacteroidota bacterium]MCY4206266.1 hypothetical protein [Bacteroidota bacterium]
MQIRDRLMQLEATRRGRYILRAVRAGFTIAILVFLVWQLRGEIEIWDVFHGLPKNPGFYLLLIVLYFLLPSVQFLAYRVVWDFRPSSGLRAFIKKRILNKDVLGYSGELYIFSWARDHVQKPSRVLLEDVRDMNIISAAASTVVAVVLLVFFALEGHVNVRALIPDAYTVPLIGGVAITTLLLLLVLKWRRQLFSMSWKATRIIFGLHVTRMLVRQVLEISMWHLAMPDVPIEVWYTYAALTVLVVRIPFIPNYDLLTMAVAVSVAEAMSVSEVQIAALFGAVALVNQLINLMFFATLSVRIPEKIDPISVTKHPLDASKKSAHL